MPRHSDMVLTRSERGQSAVELAFAFPVLLLILMGILDFGRAFYTYVSITNAAREGARYGAAYPADSAGLISQVNRELGCTNCVLPNVVCSPHACNQAQSGDEITVTVNFDFHLLTTGILPFGDHIPMSNFTTMPVLRGVP